MSARFIYTADDYGPVHFINHGVNEQVKIGTINSVHVLSNFDENKLKRAMKDLWHAVPEGKILDVGTHVTLTSGRPIFQGQRTAKLRKTISTGWGDFVCFDSDADLFVFEDYMKFYFGAFTHQDRAVYLSSIRQEFILQIDRLDKVIQEINKELGSAKLKLSSISNHHNIICLHRDLFKVYCDVAQLKNLVSRSPKMMPESDRKTYYWKTTTLNSLLNCLKAKKDARAFVEELAENKSTTKFNIKAPTFFDGRVFQTLGAVIGGHSTNNTEIERIKDEIFNAIYFATNEYPKDFEGQQVISEIIFHIGQFRSFDKKVISQDMVDGYTGVNTKYFNNRINEFEALQRVYDNRNGTINNFWSYFENPASWSEASTFYLK